MPIFPEQLLIRRYQLESELCGLGQEIQRLELQAQPLKQRLGTVDASMTDGNPQEMGPP
jgi:hypothetical protein